MPPPPPHLPSQPWRCRVAEPGPPRRASGRARGAHPSSHPGGQGDGRCAPLPASARTRAAGALSRERRRRAGGPGGRCAAAARGQGPDRGRAARAGGGCGGRRAAPGCRVRRARALAPWSHCSCGRPPHGRSRRARRQAELRCARREAAAAAEAATEAQQARQALADALQVRPDACGRPGTMHRGSDAARRRRTGSCCAGRARPTRSSAPPWTTCAASWRRWCPRQGTRGPASVLWLLLACCPSRGALSRIHPGGAAQAPDPASPAARPVGVPAPAATPEAGHASAPADTSRGASRGASSGAALRAPPGRAAPPGPELSMLPLQAAPRQSPVAACGSPPAHVPPCAACDTAAELDVASEGGSPERAWQTPAAAAAQGGKPGPAPAAPDPAACAPQPSEPRSRGAPGGARPATPAPASGAPGAAMPGDARKLAAQDDAAAAEDARARPPRVQPAASHGAAAGEGAPGRLPCSERRPARRWGTVCAQAAAQVAARPGPPLATCSPPTQPSPASRTASASRPAARPPATAVRRARLRPPQGAVPGPRARPACAYAWGRRRGGDVLQRLREGRGRPDAGVRALRGPLPRCLRGSAPAARRAPRC